MAASVLEAIRQGDWNFEPQVIGKDKYLSTTALPGSVEKVKLLAARAVEGVPLWHPDDRLSFDDSEEALR